MAIQQTYSMIKPDGVRNGHIGEIINRFERAGLTIERMELGMVTPEQAKANYAEHEGKPFYDGLIAYITSGPVVKMVVSGEGAVAKCRSLMGATNPAEAAPGTIRGDFGNDPARRQALGGNYAAVMQIVNSRLGGGSGGTAATGSRSVVVRSGDTMSAIAARTGLQPVSAWRVPSGDVNRIYPGQTVTYGGASASTASSVVGGHVVRSGESLWSIYGSGWQSAAARNGIRSPYVIYPGQYLR